MHDALIWLFILSKHCRSLLAGVRKSRYALCGRCCSWASWDCNGGKVKLKINCSFWDESQHLSGPWSPNHLCLLGLFLSYQLLCWLNTGNRIYFYIQVIGKEFKCYFVQQICILFGIWIHGLIPCSWIKLKPPSLAIYEGKMGKVEKWTLLHRILVFVTSIS